MTMTSELGLEHFAQLIGAFAVGIPTAFIFKATGVPTTPNDY
jgi:hypothetical protein